MTRLAKKILLTICSCLFTFCLAFTGMTLANTNKTVNADAASEPTVTFKGINENQNNADWQTSPGFGFTAVYLIFEGADFTANNSNGVAGITYTVPGGVATTFGFTWVAEADVHTIILLNQHITIPDGSVLNIAAGTEYAGQVLPEVTLYMADGEWVNEKPVVEPTVTFKGINENQNNADWQTSPGYGFTALYLIFEGADFTVNNSNGVAGITYTVPGGVATTFGFTWVADSDLNTIILLTKDITIPAGSVLNIAQGTSYADQILPEVTLYMNYEGKWQNTVPVPPVVEPTVAFECVEETQNNTVWANIESWKGTYLIFSGTAFEESKGINPDGIYFTDKNGENATKFTAIWTSADNGATLNMVQLLSETQAIPAGAILHIEKGTELGGQVLPEVTLYMNYEGKWQDTVPEVPDIEPTISFYGISESQNNAAWESSGSWTATYLIFIGETPFIESTSCDRTAIYYTAPNSETPVYFKAVWVQNSGSANLYTIMLLDNEVSVPNYAILHIEKGTSFQGQYLPEVTLYLIDGKWQLEDERDKIPPKFNIEDGAEINTTAGKPFVVDIKAIDEEDNAECQITYTWSQGALDENNLLVEGTHTCTVTATDSAGNEATIVLTINVGAADTEAPVITIEDTLTAFVGVVPEFIFKATDSVDGEIECTVVGLESALDENGKLVAGTYTITVTAKDLSGNEASKEVTLIVKTLDIEEPPTSDQPSGSDGQQGGCSGNIDSVSAILILVMVISASVILSIKRKNEKKN